MLWPFLTVLSLAALGVVIWRWRREAGELSSSLRRASEELDARARSLTDLQDHAEARQLALLDSMVEGVLVLDEDGRIQLANQALLQMFGVPGSLRGRTLLEAFRMEELQLVASRARAEGKVVNHELELSGADRRCLHLNATALAPGPAGRSGLLLVFHDRTRIRQLENTRREFVANVSHELRTPLSMIKGYAETLLNGAKDDPAVATRFLQTIEKHADRLTYLIEDLLTLSHLDAGQISMNLQPALLQPIVAEVVGDLQVRAADKNVSLQATIPPDLTVRADGDRLQQVLFNLVDNAIKYGRSGGRVAVAVVPRPAGMVEVQVADDGPGVPEDALPRIFERFYRADKARSREQGGTGLGLAIVKHIVQAHGGEVWVRNEPGQGATFCFTLPVAQNGEC